MLALIHVFLDNARYHHAKLVQEALRTLAELALALVLFTDAANTDMAELRRSLSLPQRLLLVGLPLTIAAGVLSGYLLFPDLGLAGIAVLAIALTPTDAALGNAVVTDSTVPARIRTTLNVENGLNDGICVPGRAADLAREVWLERHRHHSMSPERVVWSAGPMFNRKVCEADAAPDFCVSFHYWGPMLIQCELTFEDCRDAPVTAYIYARLPDARTRR
jgi:hypothetical protein